MSRILFKKKLLEFFNDGSSDGASGISKNLDERLPRHEAKRENSFDYRAQPENQHAVDHRAIFSFFALVLLQTLLGTLYKVSQTGKRYAYSTYAAFAIAEIIKFVISFTLHSKERSSHNTLKEALRATYVSLKERGLVFKIAALAGMYFANNQLTFVLFLRADPASINLLKAGSSAVTALVWCIFMGRVVSHEQWLAIAMQVCGLVVVQYDACKGQAVLVGSAYGLILISVLITATCGVWNEQQLKTMPLSLHEQNMVLYAFGALLNGAGHFMKARLDPQFPRFFEGYTFLSVCVIAVNACFGIVVTAVYKHSNAIIKTLASAVTTVVLTLVSMLFFGLHVTIVSGAGCVIVILAVMLYAFLSSNSSENDPTLDVNTRKRIAAGVSTAICGTLAAFHFYANH